MRFSPEALDNQVAALPASAAKVVKEQINFLRHDHERLATTHRNAERRMRKPEASRTGQTHLNIRIYIWLIFSLDFQLLLIKISSYPFAADSNG
jgi:hypothetical protein